MMYHDTLNWLQQAAAAVRTDPPQPQQQHISMPSAYLQQASMDPYLGQGQQQAMSGAAALLQAADSSQQRINNQPLLMDSNLLQQVIK